MFYNWNVIGHEKELRLIEDDIQANNVAHAYLFVGPEKVGKYRVAKFMAMIIQCPQNFCRMCPACLQIEKKCHPDTIELEDDGESIKIDYIRDILGRLNMTSQGSCKILLIQNIGRLTEESANSLLKTLEEPAGKTIFIFTAGQLRDIPATVASRMRIIHFKKLPDEVLLEALKERFPDVQEALLQQVLLLSLGRSGKAIQLLNSPESFQELLELYQHIQFLDENAGAATRMLAMQELAKDASRMKMFLSLLVYYYRNKLFQTTDSALQYRTIGILQEIHRVISLAARNVNPRLLLEHLMLQL